MNNIFYPFIHQKKKKKKKDKVEELQYLYLEIEVPVVEKKTEETEEQLSEVIIIDLM
jgi:hypothetical protein